MRLVASGPAENNAFAASYSLVFMGETGKINFQSTGLGYRLIPYIVNPLWLVSRRRATDILFDAAVGKPGDCAQYEIEAEDTHMLPRSQSSSPSSALREVVLPDPIGPTSITIESLFTEKLAS